MKRIILAIVLVFIVMTGQAKEKMTVWENPSTEYGTSYGDGFFYLALDVTKVELKANETVVYITAQQRSDDPDCWFRFAGDTYLKVGEKRFTIVSADGIELNKQERSNKDGHRDTGEQGRPSRDGVPLPAAAEGHSCVRLHRGRRARSIPD